MANIIIPNQEREIISLHDPYSLSGDFEATHIEIVGDQKIYHYGQRVGDIMNDNEQRRNDSPSWNNQSEFRQVASVPAIVWNLWESVGITTDQKELRKALMRHKNEHMVVEQKLI